MRGVSKGKEKEARLGADCTASPHNLHFEERKLQEAQRTGGVCCLLAFYPEYQVVLAQQSIFYQGDMVNGVLYHLKNKVANEYNDWT